VADYSDLLARLAELDRGSEVAAAVVERADDGFVVRATTVEDDDHGTWLGAGLGLAAGLLLSPALPIAIVGAGVDAPRHELQEPKISFRL
jgi:hypothetical protein